MNNTIIISNNNFDIYGYIYKHLVNYYDKNIINNFHYYEFNSNKYIKVKKSNIHIEYTPYASAIDKTIITQLIYSFCSSLNNLFYKEKKKKNCYHLPILFIKHNQPIIYYVYLFKI